MHAYLGDSYMKSDNTTKF